MHIAAEKSGICQAQSVIVGTKTCAGPLDFLETVQEVGIKGGQLSRYKGLGEMNPNELWHTTMDPSVRTMQQVSIKDGERAEQTFSDLMNENVSARRKLIEDMCAGATNIDI